MSKVETVRQGVEEILALPLIRLTPPAAENTKKSPAAPWK